MPSHSWVRQPRRHQGRGRREYPRSDRTLPIETRQIEVAMEMPALAALSSREVVRVFVAKGTPLSLIRAANVTIEESLAAR